MDSKRDILLCKTMQSKTKRDVNVWHASTMLHVFFFYGCMRCQGIMDGTEWFHVRPPCLCKRCDNVFKNTHTIIFACCCDGERSFRKVGILEASSLPCARVPWIPCARARFETTTKRGSFARFTCPPMSANVVARIERKRKRSYDRCARRGCCSRHASETSVFFFTRARDGMRIVERRRRRRGLERRRARLSMLALRTSLRSQGRSLRAPVRTNATRASLFQRRFRRLTSTCSCASTDDGAARKRTSST